MALGPWSGDGIKDKKSLGGSQRSRILLWFCHQNSYLWLGFPLGFLILSCKIRQMNSKISKVPSDSQVQWLSFPEATEDKRKQSFPLLWQVTRKAIASQQSHFLPGIQLTGAGLRLIVLLFDAWGQWKIHPHTS